MDINRFTQKAQEALSAAQSKAAHYGHQQVDAEHLLASLIEQEGGLATSILSRAGANTDNFKRRIEQELERMPRVSGPAAAPDQVYITPRLNRLLAQAEDEAKKLKDDYVSIEHLLLAMTDDNGAAGRILQEFYIPREKMARAPEENRRNQAVTAQKSATTYETLGK